MTLSDDSAAFQVGVLVVENASRFWLKFFMYDEVSAEHDYPIAKSFSKIYTASEELIVNFPYQVMMSTKRPPEEIRIDHLKEIDTHFGFPSDSYAYTALEPFIIQFDKEVNIDSFWLRLHRSPIVYLDNFKGQRTVKVYKDG